MRSLSGCLSEEGSTLNQISPLGLIRQGYEIGESRGNIITDNHAAIEAALDCIKAERNILTNYCKTHPSFTHSLEPIEVTDAPRIVALMAEAGQKAGVGPMAAVAGVITDLAVEAMINNGAEVAVVENGGEATLHSNQPISITVGSGDNPLSNKIGFKVKHFPIGVATSSGRHSHAYSMGDSDSVTVFAYNAGIADAVATCAANQVLGEPGADVRRGVEVALAIRGVYGVMAVRDGHVSTGGILPEIISVGDQNE